MGAAVSSQWLVDHPEHKDLRARLYNEPAINIFGADDPRATSYSDWLDPVSMLDREAERGSYISVPHAYRPL